MKGNAGEAGREWRGAELPHLYRHNLFHSVRGSRSFLAPIFFLVSTPAEGRMQRKQMTLGSGSGKMR